MEEADTPGVTLEDRIDELITRTEEMLRLTTEGRQIFTATEVIDFALDARTALVEARGAFQEPVPA